MKTQSTESSDVWRLVRMLGVAMYTIVVSSMIMKKPRHTTSSAGHGLVGRSFIRTSDGAVTRTMTPLFHLGQWLRVVMSHISQTDADQCRVTS